MLEKAQQQETMAALNKAEEAAAQAAAQASTASQGQAADAPPASAAGVGVDIDGTQPAASPPAADPVAWNQSPGLASRIAAMEAKDKRALSSESGKSGKQRRRV